MLGNAEAIALVDGGPAEEVLAGVERSPRLAA
jgi:hypothetical protein